MNNDFQLCEIGWKLYEAMTLAMDNGMMNPFLQELKKGYDSHRRQCDICTKPREDENVNKND